MHLFLSEGSAAEAEADLLGWDEFHKGTLTVHRLACDHVTMLDLPLARMMLESLREASESTHVGRAVATPRGPGTSESRNGLQTRVEMSGTAVEPAIG
jgi:hypothetical protein